MGKATHEFTGIEADAKCFGSVFHEISHELRNPLNSISGFAELLLMDDGLSTAHADYVRAILTGSEALTEAVVSLLDRVEKRSSVPATPVAAAPGVAASGHNPFAEAQPVPRASLLPRSGRWGYQRRLFSRGRPGRV